MSREPGPPRRPTCSDKDAAFRTVKGGSPTQFAHMMHDLDARRIFANSVEGVVDGESRLLRAGTDPRAGGLSVLGSRSLPSRWTACGHGTRSSRSHPLSYLKCPWRRLLFTGRSAGRLRLMRGQVARRSGVAGRRTRRLKQRRPPAAPSLLAARDMSLRRPAGRPVNSNWRSCLHHP